MKRVQEQEHSSPVNIVSQTGIKKPVAAQVSRAACTEVTEPQCHKAILVVICAWVRMCMRMCIEACVALKECLSPVSEYVPEADICNIHG